MLVLERKAGEKVIIKTDDGEEIEIHIARSDRNNVKMAFKAPRKYKIYRSELLNKKK